MAKQTVDIGSIIAYGVQSAHDAAYAGTDDIVNGDIRLLQHLQHTYLGSTFGTASAQYKTHLLA